MSKIDFYANRYSQPCRSVELFMRMNNIPHEFHSIDVPKGDNRTESYLKISPAGYVPAMVDGDFSMFESIAMLQYLAKKYSTPDHWYPSDIQRRARIDEYLSWHHYHTRANGAAGYFIVKFVKPKYLKVEVTDEEVEAAKNNLNKTLDFFESYYLKNTDYISSNEMSIADIIALNEFSQLGGIGVDVGQDRPIISAWYERCKKTLQPHFHEVHPEIFGLSKH